VVTMAPSPQLEFTMFEGYQADDGPTTLENLILLCRRHHRLVHEEGWTLVARAESRAGSHPALTAWAVIAIAPQ